MEYDEYKSNDLQIYLEKIFAVTLKSVIKIGGRFSYVIHYGKLVVFSPDLWIN